MNVIQHNVRIFFRIGLWRQKIKYFTSKMICFVRLGSRDVEHQLFHVKMVQIAIVHVLGLEHSFFYVFVGAPTGPSPRRAPAGPSGGPRGGPRAQGRAHQGPGPDARAKRALDSSIYIYIYIYKCCLLYTSPSPRDRG